MSKWVKEIIDQVVEKNHGLRNEPAETLEPGDLAHWIAAPAKGIGFEQFHDVVERAEKVINLLRAREITEIKIKK
jgi:predicted transcriptional regulator